MRRGKRSLDRPEDDENGRHQSVTRRRVSLNYDLEALLWAGGTAVSAGDVARARQALVERDD